MKIGAVVLTGVGAGYLLRRAFSRESSEALPEWDAQFTAAFPRSSGAVSAVTGGPPEDMNGMPATPSTEGPTWDGSQL